nr:YraN family protein [Clostridium sp. MD294]
MQKIGYTILEKNYYSEYGEIDIIAQKQNMIVFTEVKLRQTEKNGQPCEAVTKQKQKKIIQTAKHYIAQNNVMDLNMRFDVAEVLKKQNKYYFRYIENAFWLE